MGLHNYYNYLIEECIDPRTKDWFLVHSPVPIVTILLLYTYLVLIGLPNYMKNRKPYSLKTYLKFYNFFQIIVNAYVVYGTAVNGWLDSNFGCESLNTSPTGIGYNMAAVVWQLYMVKLIDLLETIVFRLRKKDRQVSALHVYHHITTALITWMFVKWLPGGGCALIMIVNCSVHVIMYTYYLLSTGGPMMQRIVAPMKPWITIVQMTQFVVLIVHQLKILVLSCDTPLAVGLIVIGDLIMNLLLFSNFYTKNYRGKKNAAKSD